MNYRQLNNQIKTGDFSSVYLFEGEEDFVKARSLKRLTDAALSGGLEELNVSVYEEETEAQEIVAACSNMPFFANRRIVVYKNCPMLLAKGKDLGEEALLSYLENPAQDTILVFYMQQKVDNRKKLTKALRKHASVDFSTLSDSDILSFITIDARNKGFNVAREAIDKLIFYCGKDMSMLVNEMEKAYAYVYPQTTIDESTIDTVATRTVEANAFTIVDHFIDGRIKKGNDLLDELLTDIGATQALFGAIGYRLRMILSAREGLDKGLTKGQIQSNIKGPRFAVNRAMADANRFTAKQLRHALSSLAEADYAIKSGQKRDRVALDYALASAFGATASAN